MKHPHPAVIILIFLVIACGNREEQALPEAQSAGNPAAPFDARFIDAMIDHHLGAVEMAEEALDSTTHPEIIDPLAMGIIAGQSAEIDSMRAWRDTWYPGLDATGGMGMSMGAMEIEGTPEIPWDLRFLEAMISHHQGAILMAESALDSAEHEEITMLATGIIAAQQEEIVEMTGFQSAWSAPAAP